MSRFPMPPAAGRCLAVCLALLGWSAPAARAHHGFDSSAEVRLLTDRTVVILRVSPPVLDALLAEKAPVRWDRAAFGKMQPELRALAAGFFEIRTGDKLLALRQSDAALELEGAAAFVLVFPPAAAPVTVRANFCRDLGPAFQGTLSVRGAPTAPTERTGPELARLELTPLDREVRIPTLAR